MAGSDNGGVRVARNSSAAAVAVIAAWSSYSHMAHVALACGEHPQVAYALPVSVDGLLIAATIVMVDDKHSVGRVRPMARLAFTAGVIASIAANIAAAHPSLGARVVNAWPALALLLVVEMLARPPAPEVPAASHVPPSADVPPEPVARSLQRYDRPLQPAEAAQVPPQSHVPPHGEVPLGAEAWPTGPLATVTDRPVANGTDVPVRPPRPRASAAATDRNDLPAHSARPTKSPGRSGVRRPTTVTRQLAYQIIDAEPDLPRAVVAARLGVSPRRLRAILATPA